MDHVGSAHGGNDDVGFSAPLRDVFASRVDHSHGRVCPTRGEKKRHWHPHNPASSQDHGALAFKRHVRPTQHFHDAGRRARKQAVGAALHESAKVHWMKAVDILGRMDAIGDGSLVEVRGKRRLHKDTVHGCIGVQFVHDGLEVLLRNRCRPLDVGRHQPEALAGLHLGAHVDVRSRVIAHDDHGEVGLNARRREG